MNERKKNMSMNTYKIAANFLKVSAKKILKLPEKISVSLRLSFPVQIIIKTYAKIIVLIHSFKFSFNCTDFFQSNLPFI